MKRAIAAAIIALPLGVTFLMARPAAAEISSQVVPTSTSTVVALNDKDAQRREQAQKTQKAIESRAERVRLSNIKREQAFRKRAEIVKKQEQRAKIEREKDIIRRAEVARKREAQTQQIKLRREAARRNEKRR